MLKLSKMKVAENIKNLLLVENRLKKIDLTLEAFENYREQGYRIIQWLDNGEVKTVAFSEHSISDDVVVYKSNKYEHVSFGYSNEFWDSKMLFKWDNYNDIIDYIINFIIQ